MVDFSAIGTQAVGIGFLLVSVLAVAAFGVAFFVVYRYIQRYKQYVCYVFERDGFGQTSFSTDEAGIFVDSKTKNKRFFLRKANVGLDPDKVPYIQRKIGGKKVVFLLRTGLKNFSYINFDIKEKTGMQINVGEEDVNWALNAYERSKKLFSQTLLMQLMPFIIIAFVSVIILIMFIFLFKDAGVMKEAAVAWRDAAQYYYQAQTGSAVITA